MQIHIMEKSCKKCSKIFECDENNSCWCFESPHINNDRIKYDDCVCKECLQLQYKERILGV